MPDASQSKRPRRPPLAAVRPRAQLGPLTLPNESVEGGHLIIDCKYANNLPDPPVPKLLRALPPEDRFGKYEPTSVELDHRPFLLSEMEYLEYVELVHPNAYGELPPQGSMPPPPPPQDSALLRDDDETEVAKEADAKRRRLSERTDAFHREAFGLQLPQLISNDVWTERQRYTTGCEASEKKLTRDAPGYKTMEDLVSRIERTFTEAQEPPVHPSNPSKKAKRVLPIVPDAVLWANRYRQITFDELEKEPQLNDILFKTVPHPRTTCFGYFAPGEGQEGSFQLAQNYVWENRGGFARAAGCNEGEAILLSFPPEGEKSGEVRFVLAPSIMKLSKQKANRLDIGLDTRYLTVKNREPSPQEQLEERDRMAAVLFEEADTEDATTFDYIDGEWVIRGDPRQTSSRDLTPHDSPLPAIEGRGPA